MLTKKKIDIVIPVFNEGSIIVDTLQSIKDNFFMSLIYLYVMILILIIHYQQLKK